MERIKAQRIEGMKNMIMLGDGMMKISTIIKKIKEYNDLLEEAETAEEMMELTRKMTILEQLLDDIGMNEEEIYSKVC